MMIYVSIFLAVQLVDSLSLSSSPLRQLAHCHSYLLKRSILLRLTYE